MPTPQHATSTPTVGVIGGGQLARMMAPAAVALGVRLRLLAADPDESAAQVIPDVTLGDYRDRETLRGFAKGCDVVTFDHEHVPTEHLIELEAGGTAVRPGPSALVHAQDKAVMRARLGGLDLPVPRWRAVETADEVAEFAGGNWPVILKTTRGGYDGKGVWLLRDRASAEAAVAEAQSRGANLLVEDHVPFVRELAALVARRPSGQAVAYPVVETVQADGVCREAIYPARIPEAAAAEATATALRIAEELDVTGILAVELFATADGAISINELAMRPHNSGHWSIDGASASQFQLHLRAVLDLPLPQPRALAPAVVMVNVLGGGRTDLPGAYDAVWRADADVRIHTYGKPVKPGRKVGHVTLLGEDVEELLARGNRAVAILRGGGDRRRW